MGNKKVSDEKEIGIVVRRGENGMERIGLR